MPITPTNPNRTNEPTFWLGRGNATIVRVHGNQRPAHLRSIARTDWMAR